MDHSHAHKPILITGIPRSGTSLVAGIIHKLGAWGGDLVGPTKYNRRGMFENSAIRNRAIKPYFRRMRADPRGQQNFPDIYNLIPYSDLRPDVLAIIRRQGYVNGPWFYKEPKMLLVWPEWADAFPGAKWILVRRHTDDIVSSCLRTTFMRAYQNEEGWLGWCLYQEELLSDILENRDLDSREVWPARILAGDHQEIQEVASWAELAWDDRAVRNFTDKDLWHGRVGVDTRPCADLISGELQTPDQSSSQEGVGCPTG